MNKEQQVVIIGAGGHGKVVLDILLESGHNVVGFLDDDKGKHGITVSGIPVLGGISYLVGRSELKGALGIGNNKVRKEIFQELTEKGVEIISAIHPKSIISRSVKMGKGVVIMPGSVINASVVIEDGVVINTGATIDHDCYLKSFAHIWPGAHLAGTVTVGKQSYVGMGAAVRQNIIIGNYVVIGAAAAVVSDIPDNKMFVGVPAKEISSIK